MDCYKSSILIYKLEYIFGKASNGAISFFLLCRWCLLFVVAPYAWDEPTHSSNLTCSLHCDLTTTSKTYNMDILGQAEHLEYENYFYISLVDTPEPLVLEVIGGNTVIFSRKDPSKRSQLWSQSVEGRILYEGTTSSKSPADADKRFCLDIAELAVITEGCSCLGLRLSDNRRQSSQIWKFQNGRLMCGIQGQCVQALPAFGGMQHGARVALGPFSMQHGLTAETHVDTVKMLPGSGMLVVQVEADGPTRVLRICDMHDLGKIKTMKLNRNIQVSDSSNESSLTTLNKRLRLSVALNSGIGVSLINNVPEELVYLSLSNVNVKVDQNREYQRLYIAVKHIQMDNQTLGSNYPVVFNSIVSKHKHKSKERRHQGFELEWQRMFGVRSSMHVFKLLRIHISPFSLNIEEIILFKILEMFTQFESIEEEVDVGKIQLPSDKEFDVDIKKCYFGLLEVTCGQLNLSVHTAKLPPELKAVKKKLGMTPLITFENAKIDFDPFRQLHPYESMGFLVTAVGKIFFCSRHSL